mmetsp:Transcript_11902/g.14166  ORF Transcript_11902/g.14166 Transcript_11902/m.14166 type:complete len:290 (+) Transcript_11902:731-1600(+)
MTHSTIRAQPLHREEGAVGTAVIAGARTLELHSDHRPWLVRSLQDIYEHVAVVLSKGAAVINDWGKERELLGAKVWGRGSRRYRLSLDHRCSHLLEILDVRLQGVRTVDRRRSLVPLLLILLVSGYVRRVSTAESCNGDLQIRSKGVSDDLTHSVAKAPTRHCCELAGYRKDQQLAYSEDRNRHDTWLPGVRLSDLATVKKDGFRMLAFNLVGGRVLDQMAQEVPKRIARGRALREVEVTRTISRASGKGISHSRGTSCGERAICKTNVHLRHIDVHVPIIDGALENNL